jgi:glycerol-3-phosphate acyltransferase PlsY
MFLILWTTVSFLLGAMPFSVWMGKLLLRTDVRSYGDGNPGAINAWRAGSYKSGLPALLLDYLKGAVPVSLASFKFGFAGWQLVVVALSPVLGHAFSPFLRFRGGKAVAVTFGIWTGLTLWEGPTMLGIFLGISFLLQRADAWSVILAMLGLLVYFLLRQADTFILIIWFGNALILVWKHRRDLRQGIGLRPYVLKPFRR